MIHAIESPQNDHYKKLLSLTTSKGLKQEGLFLLSGANLIREFLAAPHLRIVHEIVTSKMPAMLLSADTNGKIIQLAPQLFEEIDTVGTGFNLLVLEQPAISNLDEGMLKSYRPQGMEVVVPIGDPGNLGALIRSAEAFGVSRVILTQEAAHPFLPKAVKASAGSVMRMPLSRGPSLDRFPADCIALSMDGVPIDDFSWPQHGMLVVGEEGKGLGKARFSHRITIPTCGVESLNAVVAASVALALRQRSMA